MAASRPLRFLAALAIVSLAGYAALKGPSDMHPTSPQWRAGRFRNPQPVWTDTWKALASILRKDAGTVPAAAPPVVHPTPARLASPPESGLRATWFGHSSVLLDLDGARVLTDPVWSDRASPVAWAGPRRFYAPPAALEDLPVPDAVVISHDHYDHLDRPTVLRMRAWPTRFIVPLGVGARLKAWGLPADRITELDWWDSTRVAGLEITCTPARHASGRGLFDRDRTLWGGFALAGPRHRVFYSGDTGMFAGFQDIGRRLGPFDLTLIETGAYDPAWPDWHLGPEQALQAHQAVRGQVLLPLHWGLFDLAAHPWTEPIERVLAGAAPLDIRVLTPRPGESLEPASAPPPSRWWPAQPWRTHAQRPVRATLDGLRPA